MDYFKVILCGVLLTSAICTILISVYAYKKHECNSKYFSYFCISITFYSFGYAMELYSDSLDLMIFWNLIQYIGLPFIPAFWIIFTLEYNNKRLSRLTKMSIFLIPCLTFLLRYTNDIHHFFYFSVQLTTNEYFPVLYIQKGPWYWVHTMFVTVCFIVSNYLYFIMYRKSSGTISRQSLLLLIASFLPWISLLLDLLNISPLNIDYGPFAVTSSVMIFFIAFLRYQFLNIKPLARDKIFESTSVGIIVLDTNYAIIDFNPSAVSICHVLKDNIIGKDVRAILKEYNGLVDSILSNVESQFDINEPKGNYKVNTVKILEDDRSIGYIVTLTDITNYMDMVEELNHLASRDALTGVYNRRCFVELSKLELEKSKRYSRPLSMIILDLDFFKRINDNYGHQAGDAVLQSVADICRYSIRSNDILGRYGGEEFIIFLPETSLEDCHMISHRILSNIAETEIFHEGEYIKFTASIGITGVNSVTVENLDYFLKYADKALYQAKAEGRNCVRSLVVNQ
ncbi:diguanylate cyclase [Heliobacillus mobilis]|uniref:Diguanylate cyclase n=1 Tax=Heliobacterium mobile TaxID=28064 RepID=A0A6I3SH62_HELMO|nr:histidine kinase N-terminal 7TM domain-containing protein [Heliobacterium mobile]MTV48194.1 diguanylate cyclase [Heliobacterium mobile]